MTSKIGQLIICNLIYETEKLNYDTLRTLTFEV